MGGDGALLDGAHAGIAGRLDALEAELEVVEDRPSPSLGRVSPQAGTLPKRHSGSVFVLEPERRQVRNQHLELIAEAVLMRG